MEGRLMAEVDRPLWSATPLSGAPQRDRTGLLRPDVLPVALVLVATAALIVVLKLTVAGFGSIGQLTAILVTAIFLVVASFGQGLVILTGGIDLSIGAVMGIGGMIVANLTRGVDGALVYALPIALLCCTGIGVINGLGVAIGRLPPFIMTLSSSTAFFGVALGMTAGSSQQSVAPALQRFMAGGWLGIPLPVFFILLFAVAAALFQNRSAVGRQVYALGGNARAAAILGLPVTALTMTVYALSGLSAGIAGVLLAGYSSSATLDMGNALLMPTIAAVVIGGARVTGGAGLYAGTLAGALFLSTLSTAITVLSLSQGLRSLIQGGVIILALLLQSRQGGRRTN
jgi:ribose transport system permease protein